jgi:hypothetical protein
VRVIASNDTVICCSAVLPFLFALGGSRLLERWYAMLRLYHLIGDEVYLPESAQSDWNLPHALRVVSVVSKGSRVVHALLTVDNAHSRINKALRPRIACFWWTGLGRSKTFSYRS